MIGVFARMFPTKDALTEVEVEDEAWTYRASDGKVHEDQDPDAPPTAFAERLDYDGGSVVFSPLIEALRRHFRRDDGRK